MEGKIKAEGQLGHTFLGKSMWLECLGEAEATQQTWVAERKYLVKRMSTRREGTTGVVPSKARKEMRGKSSFSRGTRYRTSVLCYCY